MAGKYGFSTSSCSSSFFFFFGHIGTLGKPQSILLEANVLLRAFRQGLKAISRTLLNSLGLLTMLPKVVNGVWVYVATSLIMKCRESCRCSVRAKTLNQGALKGSMEVSAERGVCRG